MEKINIPDINSLDSLEGVEGNECIRRRSISVGQFKDVQQLHEELVKHGHHVSEGRSGLNDEDKESQILYMPEFVLENAEKVIELFIVSVQQLGFSKDDYKEGISGIRIDDIYAKAINMGFKLLPPEAGPQMFLKDVCRIGEGIVVGMKPIYRPNEQRHYIYKVFNRDGVQFLVERHGESGSRLFLSEEIAFTR